MRRRIQLTEHTHAYVEVPDLTPALPGRCAHLGAETGKIVECLSCRGRVQVKTFACAVHGECSQVKRLSGVACCRGCPDATSQLPTLPAVRQRKWAYGLTTVPGRRDDLLPRTLASLTAAGFDRPRLFVDGENNRGWWERAYPALEITTRWPVLRTHGNWLLALHELFIREPTAERYAVFQDDFVTYRGLRAYLDSCQYPERGYWNLYTFPSNQSLCPPGHTGWYRSNQFGRGAVALVFDRETVLTLLSSRHMVERPLDPHRGWKAVDGGIVTALQKAGWTEYVHNPSLVQHMGDVSSMRNRPHKKAESFRGEGFDARSLVK